MRKLLNLFNFVNRDNLFLILLTNFVLDFFSVFRLLGPRGTSSLISSDLVRKIFKRHRQNCRKKASGGVLIFSFCCTVFL
jgi:hypothetical protein